MKRRRRRRKTCSSKKNRIESNRIGIRIRIGKSSAAIDATPPEKSETAEIHQNNKTIELHSPNYP